MPRVEDEETLSQCAHKYYNVSPKLIHALECLYDGLVNVNVIMITQKYEIKHYITANALLHLHCLNM